MATAAAVEAALNTAESLDVGSPDVITITQTNLQDATYTNYYCVGNAEPFSGKAMWVRTTTADAAADQAVTIKATMQQIGNRDPVL